MTSLRPFILGLAATFVVPWLALVVIPHARLKAQAAETWQDEEASKAFSYPAGTPNIFRQGQQVYAAEGCASCHTQMIRPTYLGLESWRPGFGNAEGSIEAPVRVRETRPRDYAGERYAFLGVARIGPDLSNVGYRHSEAWHHVHLYAPKAVRQYSTMPSFRHLYEKRRIRGQRSADALELPEGFDPGEGYEVVPTEKARALVGYLMTLKKDAPLPPGPAEAGSGAGAADSAAGDVE